MIKINIHKKLGGAGAELLLNLDLEIIPKTFVAIYGKSGAGKTSTLRMLAGLLTPDRGRIEVNGQTWLDSGLGIHLRPQQRKAGIVFQDYALFPNMTVRQNLEFALLKGQAASIVDDLLAISELTGLQDRKPNTLSGGQQQRVALARALVQRPDLLLLDEPLSALDPEMRTRLQEYILKLHREYGLTTLLVSHNQPEILRMADRVLVLEDGLIVEDGLPVQVFGLERQTKEALQFSGVLLALQPQPEGKVLMTILSGTEVIHMEVGEGQAAGLKAGDRVLAAAKVGNIQILPF